MTDKACFYGVGVGPGDPELMTLKAHRLIQNADVVAFLVNEQDRSQAREIAGLALCGSRQGQQQLAIKIVMCRDRSAINRSYDQAADKIVQVLTNQESVVFLCEGDPLFFGSFAYLMRRVSKRFRCEVVPGISSVDAASAALKKPLTIQQENLAVISGRSSDQQIINALHSMDSVVIMKAGQERPRLLNLLRRTGRFSEACYLEYISRNEQTIIRDLEVLSDQPGPYFSLFVVHRNDETRNFGHQISFR